MKTLITIRNNDNVLIITDGYVTSKKPFEVKTCMQ